MKEVVVKGEWDKQIDVEEVEECVVIIKELIYSEDVTGRRRWNVDNDITRENMK